MSNSITVRYYAQLRDAIKVSEEEIPLTLPLTEKEILEVLTIRHPKQRALLNSSRVAINEAYVDSDTPLHDFSAIDIISPVSGG